MKSLAVQKHRPLVYTIIDSLRDVSLFTFSWWILHAPISRKPPTVWPMNIRSENPAAGAKRTGPMIITILVVILIVLHQDNWFWNNDMLVFGMLPITLFYHLCISIAASFVWFLATKIAWPVETIEQVKGATGGGEPEETH